MNPIIKKLLFVVGGCSVLVAGFYFTSPTFQTSVNNLTSELVESFEDDDMTVNSDISDIFTSTAPSLSTVVDVNDLILKQTINASLDRPSDADLTVADMQSLTSLTCMGCGISDLTGLEHATNLVQVELHENYISDLSPLADLTKLESVCLADNAISDISALAHLENMTTLEMSHNNISDLSPVANLTNLEAMSAVNNEIEDITVLTGLTSLKSLDLSQNNVQNIEALATIDTLERANLQQNPIEDVTAVMGLYGTENTQAVMKGDMEAPQMDAEILK